MEYLQEVRGICNWEFQLPGKEKNSVNSFPKTLHSSLIKSGNLNIQVYIGSKKLPQEMDYVQHFFYVTY